MTAKGDFSNDRRLLLISAIALFVGALGTVTGAGLLALIRFFTNLFYFQRFSILEVSPATHTLGLWAIFVPAIGGLIIGLTARYGSDAIRGHGIPEALEAILFRKSVLKLKVAILKPLSSAISIGSGGPFGAEGPIIMTGGAIGSLVGQRFHLTASERKTLLVAGAAAGMSAVFDTPIAAVLLAVELLLFEWRPRSLVPVALASLTASALRHILLGTGPLFAMSTAGTLDVGSMGACALLGLCAGVFSLIISGTLYKVEDLFHKLPFHWMWWCVIGGFAVGIGGYFEPRALGVGYDVIRDLLAGNFTPGAAAGLLGVKSLIWVIALGSGTSGGVLAPLLMMGGGLGVVIAPYLPANMHGFYPLLGMAAIMGGMMRSPFTATLFAFELTHDIDSLAPVFIASIFAYATTVLLMRRSILTEKVARRGFHIYREYGVDPLESATIADVMTKEVATIPSAAAVADVLGGYFGGARKRSGYPIVDGTGKMVGIVTKGDLLDVTQDDFLKPILEFAEETVITVTAADSCRMALDLMNRHAIGRLAVVVPGDRATLVGIVSRTDLLRAFAQHTEAESVREKIPLGAP